MSHIFTETAKVLKEYGSLIDAIKKGNALDSQEIILELKELANLANFPSARNYSDDLSDQNHTVTEAMIDFLNVAELNYAQLRALYLALLENDPHRSSEASFLRGNCLTKAVLALLLSNIKKDVDKNYNQEKRELYQEAIDKKIFTDTPEALDVFLSPLLEIVIATVGTIKQKADNPEASTAREPARKALPGEGIATLMFHGTGWAGGAKDDNATDNGVPNNNSIAAAYRNLDKSDEASTTQRHYTHLIDGVGSRSDHLPSAYTFSYDALSRKATYDVKLVLDNPIRRGAATPLGIGIQFNKDEALQMIRACHELQDLKVINLVGFSRGAYTAMLVADALSRDPVLKDVPVNLFLIEPVIGPFGTDADSPGPVTLSENVKEAQVILHEHESRSIMDPLNWNTIKVQNPIKTKVDYTVFPGAHPDATKFRSMTTQGATRLCAIELREFLMRNGSPTQSSVPESVPDIVAFKIKKNSLFDAKPSECPAKDLTVQGRLALYNNLRFDTDAYKEQAEAEGKFGNEPPRSFLKQRHRSVMDPKYFSGPRHRELFHQVLPLTFDYCFCGNSQNKSPEDIKEELEALRDTESGKVLLDSMGAHFSEVGLTAVSAKGDVMIGEPHGLPHFEPFLHLAAKGDVSEYWLKLATHSLLTMPSMTDASNNLAAMLAQEPKAEDLKFLNDKIKEISKAAGFQAETLQMHFLKTLHPYCSSESWRGIVDLGSVFITEASFIAAESDDALESSGASAAAAAAAASASQPDVKDLLQTSRSHLQNSLVSLLMQNNKRIKMETAENSDTRGALPKMGVGSRADGFFKRLVPTIGGRAIASIWNGSLLNAVKSEDGAKKVKAALANNANINVEFFDIGLTHSGRTPAMIAAALRHWECLEALLDHHNDSSNEAQIDFARNNTAGKSNILHLLAETDVKRLDSTGRDRYEAVVNKVLSAIASSDKDKGKVALLQCNINKLTPLEKAIERENPIMVKALFNMFHVSEIVSPQSLTHLASGASAIAAQVLEAVQKPALDSSVPALNRGPELGDPESGAAGPPTPR